MATRGVGTLVVLALLLAQPGVALAYPTTITYGRSWPLSVVVDSARGLVYVDGTSGEYPPTGFSFGVINATSHSLIEVLPLRVTPGAMAFDAERNRVYVAGADSIEVYFGGTQNFVGNISTGRPILDMAFDVGTGNLYFTSGSSVYEIDPNGFGNSIVANQTVEGGAGGLAIDPTNGKIFVADYASASVFVFRSSTLTPVGTIRLPSCCPSGLALNPNSQVLYTATGTNYVDMLDAGTDTFTRSVPVAPSSLNSTSSIVVDNGTGRVFVSFSSGGSIVELSPDGGVLGTLRTDGAPAGIAVDEATGELYATNYHEVSVFDTRTSPPGPDYVTISAAAGALAVGVVLMLVIRSWSHKAQDGHGRQ
jgi:DNA-binding beta-propeller fold protein YncE